MAEGTVDDYKQAIEYAKKFTAAKTNEVVTDDLPEGDARYVIDFLMVGGDTAGTFQILNNDNAAIDGYFWAYGANGGVVIEDKYLKGLGAGKGIRFTQTGGGNYTVILKYHEERV